MNEKIKISLPIIVEGKYDKNTLSQIFDANIITLGGFGIFNSKEKQCLIRKISENGIILLTDSDGAGGVIRSFIKGMIPPQKVYNLYIPKIEGKEKRKVRASKEGYLGVEGMNRDMLIKVFKPFMSCDCKSGTVDDQSEKMITKVDFYMDKITGFDNSSILRNKLAGYFGLPEGMSANALLEALNIITDKKEYKIAISSIVEK